MIKHLLNKVMYGIAEIAMIGLFIGGGLHPENPAMGNFFRWMGITIGTALLILVTVSSLINEKINTGGIVSLILGIMAIAALYMVWHKIDINNVTPAGVAYIALLFVSEICFANTLMFCDSDFSY